MTKALLTFLVAALVMAFVAAEAMAVDEDEPTPRTTSARLEVDGNGTVLLRGRFVVFGQLASRSLLIVTDRAGDGRLTIDGESVPLRKRKQRRIRRAEGRVYITGRNVVIVVRSRDATLSVAGRGRAWLRGDGVFRLNDGPSFTWDGTAIPIHPSTPPDLGRDDGNQPSPTQRAPRRVVAIAEPAPT